MRFVLFCLLLVSWPAFVRAESRFDGTWRIDLSESKIPTKPEIYLLQGSEYLCSSCDPPLRVRADGRDHKIAGGSCYDTVNVEVVDSTTTLETDKRGGKVVGSTRMTISSGGDSATVEWTESCNANGDVVTGKDILRRIAQGPHGSHAVSGSWRMVKRENRSENPASRAINPSLQGGGGQTAHAGIDDLVAVGNKAAAVFAAQFEPLAQPFLVSGQSVGNRARIAQFVGQLASKLRL